MKGGKQSIVVEFLGLPGAGKTTNARRLAHELTTKGVALCYRHGPGTPKGQRIRTLCASILRHPLVFASFVRVTAGHIGFSWRTIKRVALLWETTAWILHARDKNTPLTLMDEGCLQQIWALRTMGCNMNQDRWAAFIRKIKGHSRLCVVIFDMDPDEALHRIESRDQEHAKKLELRNAIHHHMADLQELKKYAQAEFEHVHVSGTDDDIPRRIERALSLEY